MLESFNLYWTHQGFKYRKDSNLVQVIINPEKYFKIQFDPALVWFGYFKQQNVLSQAKKRKKKSHTTVYV